MIKLEKTTNGFKLYYKEYLFLHHTLKQPCLKIGSGKGRFKSKYGSFKIKDKVRKKVSLLSFKIVSETENQIVIDFETESEKVNVLFESKNDYLEIKPSCPNPDFNRFWLSLNGKAGEAIYGGGEQFSELNLRGKNLPLWVEENGLCRGDPKWLTFLMNLIVGVGGHWHSTYYPQPTFVSSENYFCHVDTTAYAEFDFKNASRHSLYIWDVPKRIIIGKYENALKTVSKLSEFLGRQPELPEWAFDGVWLGIQGGNEVVEQKIMRCLDKGVIVKAAWCQDWEGVRIRRFGKRLFWNWKYDDDLYPNLPSFIHSLDTRGIKFLGYINSFLTVEEDAEMYNEASAKGYCVKDKLGNDYYIKTGNGTTALLDLTNPKAIEWLKSIIKKNMIEVGLSGWMADFGEYLPTDAVLHSGENPEEFHNKYPVIWAKAIRDAIEEAGKLGEIVSFTRSGYTYTSKYTPLVWAGDQLVNWGKNAGLGSVIPAGLSLGICGIGYHHSDVGGYTTFWRYKRTKEVFMRWAEHAAFTMVMRTHEGNMPDKNIQFDEDEELLDHFAKMSQIHVHLKPYLMHLSQEYQKDGIPPMRTLHLHYEDDPEVHSLKYQYLFGSDLLVAPVIKPKTNNWKVYLPENTWIHAWSGKQYTKGWHEVEAPLGKPPIFYLKNSEFADLFNQLKKFAD